MLLTSEKPQVVGVAVGMQTNMQGGIGHAMPAAACLGGGGRVSAWSQCQSAA